MRKEKSCFICVAILLIALILPLPVPAMAKKKAVSLSQSQMVLAEGKSKMLKLQNAGKKKGAWKVKDSTVATVTNGKVTALQEGKTVVSAKVGKKTLSCTVKVVKALDRDDFTIGLDDEESGEYFSNFIDYAKYWAEYPNDVVTADRGDTTIRGVGIGSTYKEVANAYGEVKKYKQSSFGERILNEMIYGEGIAESDYLCDYAYTEGNDTYHIIFGFQGKKVTSLSLVENFV